MTDRQRDAAREYLTQIAGQSGERHLPGDRSARLGDLLAALREALAADDGEEFGRALQGVALLAPTLRPDGRLPPPAPETPTGQDLSSVATDILRTLAEPPPDEPPAS
ncbi:hypothetical protein ABT278_34940 [Streptomyces sp. NPDC001228]|uniref:hypothetical protein n=1 Tax=Streptomyces sp. NPDC001228 TaxID=3154381 RepID=UPI003330A731